MAQKRVAGDRDLDTLSGTGTVDHMAFAATGVNEMRDRLKKHDIAYRERTVPSLNLHQIFFEDPSGVTIELNYPGSEVQQAA